jgi:hypothetical protein
VIALNLDISSLLTMEKNLVPVVTEAVQRAATRLTQMTKEHIVEEASKKLHTRRQMFIEHLTVFPLDQGGDQNTWVINLDKKYRWIDDGMKQHEMIDDLLKSKKTKTSKDGSRYLTIPFDHSPGKGKTGTTPAGKTLIDTVRKELKSRGIAFGQIEKGPDGKPLLGTLHNIDITKEPKKTGNGPGQGHGPIGQVRQGMTGIPFLQGIQISQKMVKDPKTGKEGVKRSIMTFRTVSSKMKGSGRWVHPGLEANHMMEEGARWASDQWQRIVGPEVAAAIVKKL